MEINEWAVCVLAFVFFTVPLSFHCYYYHCLREHATVWLRAEQSVGISFVYHLYSFVFGFRVAPILGSGTLVFAKEWFFLGVLVFLF